MAVAVNPLSANTTKWSNTLKLPTNCLSVFDYFVILALKGLTIIAKLCILGVYGGPRCTSLINLRSFIEEKLSFLKHFLGLYAKLLILNYLLLVKYIPCK